jgi:hypothetical protein
MTSFYIQSKHLQLAEPLMQKYFDCNSLMLFDEIKFCVEKSGINYIYPPEKEGDLQTANFPQAFKEHKELVFFVNTPYKKGFYEQFSEYFYTQGNNKEEVITEDDLVLLTLTYISYIYYKDKQGYFYNSFMFEGLDIEYQSILHHKIYPEILSLYKMILESKTKKHRSSKVTITYKQDKIDVNAYSWFLDDLEKYFKDRFPDLTLEKINQIQFGFKGKAGRKFNDRTITTIIWGTYQLLYNYHSKFKNSKIKISNEICQFIIDYLDYLNIENSYTTIEIRDVLKDMIKRNYVPLWNVFWKNLYSEVKEKPENTWDVPLRRYDIYG